MISQFRHVGIVVSDLTTALNLWCEGLGFELALQMEESGPFIDSLLGLHDVRVTTAKLKGPDGSMVELLQFHSHPDKPEWQGTPCTTGLTHIALTVEDIVDIQKRLSRFGVVFIAEPQTSVDGGARVAYARAHEGLLLEFVQMLR